MENEFEAIGDDISLLLINWKEISEERKLLEKKEGLLKDKIKIFLKEKHWDRYNDVKTKISVTITRQEMEKIDKKQLRIMLGESEYAQIVNKTVYEKMLIVTPERRKQLNKFINGGDKNRKIS